MKLKQLFSSPEKWTKNTYAKDHNDLPVSHTSCVACKFCLAGAIYVCYPGRVSSITNKIMTAILDSGYKKTHEKYNLITDFNDNPRTTFADIKQLVEDLNI